MSSLWHTEIQVFLLAPLARGTSNRTYRHSPNITPASQSFFLSPQVIHRKGHPFILTGSLGKKVRLCFTFKPLLSFKGGRFPPTCLDGILTITPGFYQKYRLAILKRQKRGDKRRSPTRCWM